MAGYSAVIDVRVQGQEDLRALSDGVARINQLIKQVKPVPTLFDKRGVTEVVAAKKELSDLVEAYAKGKTEVAKFSTSIAGINNQLNAFRAIASNAKTGTDDFNNALKAAAISSTRLLDAELDRFTSLQQIYTRQEVGTGKGPSKTVRDLLDLQKNVPNSVSALERYQRELLDVQNLVSMTSVEYQELARAIRQVDVALGKGGQFGPAAPPVQGPALPPNFIPPTRPSGGSGMPGASGPTSSVNPLQRAADMQENLMLGAGFPLLFGGGAGQVAGGLLGSFVGTGFGGQILGSAIGQQFEDAIVKTKELDTILDTLDADKLRDSIVRVTGELEYQIDALTRAGRAEEARALAAKAVYETTGLSAETIDNVANKTLRLQQSWEGLVGSGRGLVAAIGGLSSVIPGLTAILDLTATVVRGWTQLLSLTLDVGTGLRGWLQNLVFGAGTSDKVREKFGGINEETEKLKAQLKGAVDQQLRSALAGKKLLDIEKQRTTDVSLQGKLRNIDLDKQEKFVQLERTAADRKAEALLKYAGLKDAASQRELALLLKLIDAEANQGKETAKIVAARQKLQEINNTLVEQDKVRIALMQMQGDIEKAREDANDKVRAGQIQELEQRKQIALSLNDELSAVNSIYTQKKQGIDAAYAATQREAELKVKIAAADLASVQAQKARGTATAEQVAQAQNVYNTAVAVTQETLRGAAAVKSAATSAADLERRQQTVAAYAGQFARNTQQASNALNEQAAAIDNQTKLVQAQNQAYITINNIQIDSLRTQLETTKNTAQRAQILNQIRDLEINNATAILYTTRSQIVAEVERQRIAYQQVQLKYEELQATVNIARAQNLLNQGYLDALANQRSALAIAKNNYETSQGIAKANWRAADAVYNAAVKAATLKSQTQGAATAAGQFAGSMERAANSFRGIELKGFSQLEPWMEQKIAAAKQAAISTSRDPMTSYLRGINAEIAARSQFEAILNAQRQASNTEAESQFWATASSLGFGKFASGGYVTGPTMGLVGEGGESEYIIPASKMATASANYLAGGRGAGIMEGGGGGGSAPSINITTGPVVEFNGERYVTMRDMERGLQQMATSIYSGLRTPAGRYATGVR